VGEVRVAVIDDDWYKREHMREVLDLSPEIAVVHAIDQDEACSWTDEQWGELDVAVVDVYDDGSPLEIGTDMFSGIPALECLRSLNVRTVAVTPHRHHPLVEHRIYQAGANELYRRWELNDPSVLVRVVLFPDPSRAPTPVPRTVLRRYGADRARINRIVAAYERSALYGRLYEGTTHRAVKLSRRTIEAFLGTIRREHVYAPTDVDDAHRGTATWRHVRDLILRTIGRKDAPPSEDDEQDQLWAAAVQQPREPSD